MEFDEISIRICKHRSPGENVFNQKNWHKFVQSHSLTPLSQFKPSSTCAATSKYKQHIMNSTQGLSKITAKQLKLIKTVPAETFRQKIMYSDTII